VDRLATRSRQDTTLAQLKRVPRVLLIGERFLLLDAIRTALAAQRMEVAVSGDTAVSIDEALGAFEPSVVVFDGSSTSAESATRSIRRLIHLDRLVIAIASDAVSVEAARMAGAGADCVFGLDTPLDSFAESITRGLSGREAMPMDRRYVLEKLLRKYRTAEQRRWLPFDELTARERDIFAMVYAGLSADQIAEDECVSVSTVRSHIQRILVKLNVNSQIAAVALARSNQWFSSEPVGLV